MTDEMLADTLIVCGNALIASAARHALRPSARTHLGPFRAWRGRCGRHRVLVVESGDTDGTAYNAAMLSAELSGATRIVTVHPTHATAEQLHPGDLVMAESLCGVPTDNMAATRVLADMTAHFPRSAVQPRFSRVADDKVQARSGSCGAAKCAHDRGMMAVPLLLVTSTPATDSQAEFASNKKRIATFVSDAIRHAIHSLP